DYTDSTWKALQAVLPGVNEVLGNVNAMQEEVDEVYTELVKAFVNLRLKPNKDLLQDLINKANGLNRANYTVASLKLVDEEAAKASIVLNDPEATVEEVTNAVNGLTKAMAGLEVNPTNPPVENATNNPGNTVKPGDTTVNATKTGDDSSIGATAGLTVLGLIGLLFNRKRTRKE
ncbi:LPXTG cell wall anchor domain-containing protein, partial [Thomasclavelia sp.]